MSLALSDLAKAAWSFEEASSPGVDATGRGNAMTWSTVTGSVVSRATGLIAYGLYCYGAGSYAIASGADVRPGPTDPFTAAGWVKLESGSSRGSYGIAGLSVDPTAGGRNLCWEVTFDVASNTFSFTVYLGDGGTVSATSTAVTFGLWHLVRVWRDPSADLIGIQVDCLAPVTATLNGDTALVTATGGMWVGGGPVDAYWGIYEAFYGTLDAWGYWSRAFIGDEHSRLFNYGRGQEYSYGAVQNRDVLYNPQTLTGTKIYGGCNAAQVMSARTHRQASQQRNEIELWYEREGTWHLSPAQPVFEEQNHVILHKAYRQPTVAEFLLPDHDGTLTPENLGSSYNYDSDGTTYDPLIDEARKVLLRAGVWCWNNLADGLTPTASLAPSSGSLGLLSDGEFGDAGAGTASEDAAFVRFSPASATPFTLTYDLGSVQHVRHSLARFGTRSGACSLPASVQWSASVDGALWVSWPAKPVGGTDGDWDESPDGQVVDMIRADMDYHARYVRITITPTGAQTIWLDEWAVYGGSVGLYLGANVFTGYLGDEIDIAPEGYLRIRATDVTKKLGDNNEARLTQQYGTGSAAVDLADVVYLLLTSPVYWVETPPNYNAPFTAAEIGWNYGVNVTGFALPVWQGQANNMQGYCLELVHLIGWEMRPDGNGILYLREPPYTRTLPEKLYVAANDGNGELRHAVRLRTGKDMRNVVEVATGGVASGTGSTVRLVPQSVRKYGRRRVIITDPLLNTDALRSKTANAVLRDYAWRLKQLTAQITGDFETQIKQVIGFRTARRPALHAKYKAGAHLGELWVLDQYDEHISKGQWHLDGQFTPYLPNTGPQPPLNVTATPDGGDATKITVAWDNSLLPDGSAEDPSVTGYYIYVGTSDTNFPLTTTNTTAATGSPRSSFTVTGLTPGTTYWFYVTAIGPAPAYLESQPSSIVPCLAGGAASDDTGWTVTDLVGSVGAPSTQDDGTVLYQMNYVWTSPPVGATAQQQAYFGFKHGEFRYAIGSIPDDPTNPESWLYGDEWHGPRVPSLLTWDRSTEASITFQFLLHTDAAIPSGTTIYFRLFTWSTTNGFGGVAHASNVASYVMP